MNQLLERTYYDNTVYDYLITLGIIILGLTIIRLFKGPVLRKVRSLTERTTSEFDDFLVDSIDRFGVTALYVFLVSIGLRYLTLSIGVANFVRIVSVVIITFLIIRFISSVVLMLLTRYVRSQDDGEEKVKQLYGLMVIINIAIWSIGILFLFSNLGFNVTAIIASMGIGGIAIALAAQNIVGDIFNYFVIFLDRPFEVGDFVAIDDKSGVIEYIGLKTTRIKTLPGEQLVFSNSDLTSSRIHNYKKMERRRITFTLEVVHQTPYDQLKEIPDLIKSVVKEHRPITFDRAHFFSYEDSSLKFEVVYYVESADFNIYMDIQQSINLRLYQELGDRGINLAYPTRTVYMNNDHEEPKMIPAEGQ